MLERGIIMKPIKARLSALLFNSATVEGLAYLSYRPGSTGQAKRRLST
jgi:hypothetical protein